MVAVANLTPLSEFIKDAARLLGCFDGRVDVKLGAYLVGNWYRTHGASVNFNLHRRKI